MPFIGRTALQIRKCNEIISNPFASTSLSKKWERVRAKKNLISIGTREGDGCKNCEAQQVRCFRRKLLTRSGFRTPDSLGEVVAF
jgi:hypothetical protein